MVRVATSVALTLLFLAGSDALAKRPVGFGPAAGASYALAFSPDGKYLAVPGQDGVLRLWDIATKKKAHHLKGKAPVSSWSVAFTPDSKRVAAPCNDSAIRVWDVATGKVTHVLGGHDLTVCVWSVAIAPDGKTIASGSDDQTIRVWSLVTGKEIRAITGQPAGVWPVAFAPDGKTIAAGCSDGSLILWDAATGKKVRQLQGLAGGIWPLVFSPDGRTLAACVWNDTTIALFDPQTGKIRRQIQSSESLGGSLAFSPDGRTLHSGGSNGVVYSWEVVTGKERQRFAGNTAGLNPVAIHAVAISANGCMAALTDGGGTNLVWNIAELAQGIDLGKKELARLWTDLKDESAETAYRAIWTLKARPKLAIPFLRERVQPRHKVIPDPRKIAQLIADLDNDKFLVRRAATVALERLGALAEKALRDALLGSPPPEKRMRIGQILSKIEAQPLSADQVHLVRALEVLELVGTMEARKVFADLAKQDKDGWLSQEAKASVVRLARRP